jgi:hypothetical protein
VTIIAFAKNLTIRRPNVLTVIVTTRQVTGVVLITKISRKIKIKKNDSKNTFRLPRSNLQAEQSSPVYTSNKPQDNGFADKRSYASATKNKLNNHSNKNTDNDFMNSLLLLINAFVSQLLQKIIENLPTIINSLHTNPNESS